ncbi:MAG: hypothetical protein H7Z17_13195 [Fuerstia sp.]|nr:hypothetical protein [Fuerstiella sp.]
MRLLFLTSAILFAVTTSSLDAFQMAPPPSPDLPGGGSGSDVPPVPWRFTEPEDGSESFGNVLFSGTGPESDLGGLSIYSYHNTYFGDVYASELQLQIGVIVDTDPGVEWMGPAYNQLGEGYATIMPALGTPNMTLLPLVEGGGTGGTGGIEINTLVLVSGGDGVLFRVLQP